MRLLLNHFRFIPPQNVFAPPEENPDNECFCLNEEGCNVPRGLFNMSACQFGSPTMMSWPHFLDVSLFLLPCPSNYRSKIILTIQIVLDGYNLFWSGLFLDWFPVDLYLIS